jgi:hypothetical protein
MYIVFDIASTILENMDNAKNDIYAFLARLSGMKEMEIADMEAADFADMVVDTIQLEGFRDFFQRVQLSRELAGSALGQKDVTGIHQTVCLAGEDDFSLADTLRRIGIKGMESHAVHQMSLRIADQFKVEVFSRLDDLFISLNSKILCAAQTDACGKEDG